MKSSYYEKVESVVQDILNKQEEDYKKLGKNPDRKKYRRSVLVILEDGSFTHVKNSYVKKYANEDGEWYIIFSEHYEPQIHSVDDVLRIEQFSGKQIILKKLMGNNL